MALSLRSSAKMKMQTTDIRKRLSLSMIKISLYLLSLAIPNLSSSVFQNAIIFPFPRCLSITSLVSPLNQLSFLPRLLPLLNLLIIPPLTLLLNLLHLLFCFLPLRRILNLLNLCPKPSSHLLHPLRRRVCSKHPVLILDCAMLH